jgi:aminotransferase
MLKTNKKTHSTEKRDVISRRVREISPSGIRKFFDILSSMEDVISLGVGEPDFVTPWRIREAGIYSLEQGYTSYTSNYGILELREEIAQYLHSRYGIEYDAGTEILITVGVSEGLDLAMRAVIDPGDEVIGYEPSYVSYLPCTILAGGKFIPVPTTLKNEFRVKAEDIEKQLTPNTKAVMLGYPSNPTGAVMDRSSLEQIAEVVERHGLLVISDEVYERLVYGIKHVCFASLPGMRECTIHLGGFSKAFAMTGWRIGFAAARADIIEAMMKIHQYTMMCAPTMAQMAALEALRGGDEQVKEMLDEYDQRRRVMVKGFNDIGLDCFEPRGAFYAFPSIKTTGMTSEVFAEKLLLEEHVAVVPGDAFGKSGEGHVRCCYATSMEEIEEALERMGRFVKKYRAR